MKLCNKYGKAEVGQSEYTTYLLQKFNGEVGQGWVGQQGWAEHRRGYCYLIPQR